MEYEELRGATTAQHMAAGTCAGILEHCIIYPVDLIKTRTQCLRASKSAFSQGLFVQLKNLVFHEGFRQSFRGVDVVVLGAGPAHALYFGIYEHVKKNLESRVHPDSGYNHFAHAISGSCATLAHDAIMTPADAIKQRMQVTSDSRSTSFKCFQTVIKSTGVSTLYRAYFTQLALNVPFQCVHFVTYEFLQRKLNPDKQYKPWTHIVSGGIAGGTAAAITTPLDVCKTVLNTQDVVDGKLMVVPTSVNTQAVTTAAAVPSANVSSVVASEISATVPSKAVTTVTTVVLKSPPHVHVKIRGLFGAIRTVLESQGPLGLFRGMNARVVAILPGTAISWSIYEYFKWILSRRNVSGVSKNPEQQIDTWA
nr:mitoferrin 1 [Hymenolepis microstoma]